MYKAATLGTLSPLDTFLLYVRMYAQSSSKLFYSALHLHVFHCAQRTSCSCHSVSDKLYTYAGFTKVFPTEVGDNIRTALASLTNVIYALQSETMSDEHWAVLALDCSELGQILVAVFGQVCSPGLFTRTIRLPLCSVTDFHVCACVNVCVRKRDRKRARERARVRKRERARASERASERARERGLQMCVREENRIGEAIDH